MVNDLQRRLFNTLYHAWKYTEVKLPSGIKMYREQVKLIAHKNLMCGFGGIDIFASSLYKNMSEKQREDILNFVFEKDVYII